MLDHRYAIAIARRLRQFEDAYKYSQGTRVHIYRWLDAVSARDKASKGELHSLPKLETKKKWTKKVKPGTLPTSTSRLPQTEPVVQGYQHLATSPSLSAKTTWRSSLTMRS
jgi:hypothetical protein